MSLIKKKILLISGGTYNVNILLTGDIKDLGVFDTLEDTEMVGQITYADSPLDYSFVNTYNFLNFTESSAFTYPYSVSGNSSSRLTELEKYVISTDPNVKYISGGSLTTNGLYAWSIT